MTRTAKALGLLEKLVEHSIVNLEQLEGEESKDARAKTPLRRLCRAIGLMGLQHLQE